MVKGKKDDSQTDAVPEEVTAEHGENAPEESVISPSDTLPTENAPAIQPADDLADQAEAGNLEAETVVEESSEPDTGEGAAQTPDSGIKDVVSEKLEPTSDIPQIDTAPQASAEHSRSRLLWLLAPLALLLIACGTYLLAFSGRATPGVQLAGQNATGKNQAELKALAASQATLVKLQLKTDKATETASPTEIGITFDAAATASKALAAKKQSIADRIQFWRTENVPLAYKLNRTAFNAYLQKHLIEGWKLPIDAKLAFNPETKSYDIISPQAGEGVNMNEAVRSIDSAMAKPGSVTVPIKPVPTNAAIGQTAATTAQKKANTLLKSDIQFFHSGNRVFYFVPEEIDTLIDITPKTETSQLEISVNPDRVQEFVDTNVTSTIARAARDQIVIVNPNTGDRLVLQEGVRGQKLVANDKLASSIVSAFKSGKPYHTDIEVEDGGYGEQVYTGVNRWAEVNLTRQEAYMHLDDKIIQTFRISSGRAATPSDPGEWAVSRRLPITTMRGTINGESYVVPNVPWVSYFNPDGEAFHGAYWHNNFGTPMSHGCINMTIADAHMMYNFTYIGMRVSVHY